MYVENRKINFSFMHGFVMFIKTVNRIRFFHFRNVACFINSIFHLANNSTLSD